MPDNVTPAAADPATPAAAAPAPAAAAPATPAAPAAPAVAHAAASLLDVVAPAAAPAAPAAPVAPAAPADEWFVLPNVKGEGPRPEWFNSAKYKTLADQAQAYTHAEKRLGAFTGAPADGKYEFQMPEGIAGEFDQQHPILVGFTQWAAKNQLSQSGYSELLSMFATYEAGLAPDMNQIKADLGENADARIASASNWAKANLDAAGVELFREATAGANAAAVFKLAEALIGKTRQVALPAPGAGNDTGGTPTSLTPQASIDALRNQKDAKGNFLYLEQTAEGQALRHKINQMQVALAQAQQQAAA